MTKRHATQPPSTGIEEPRTNKKPRHEKSPSAAQSSDEDDIETLEQLNALLDFRRNSALQLTNGLRIFKRFLQSLLYPKSDIASSASTSPRSLIVKRFLDSHSQAPADAADKVFLPDFLKLWSVASQNNDDTLTTFITSVFTLLLKFLDEQQETEDDAVGLGKSILKYDDLKPLSRCIAAPKHKEYLISATLELLTTLVSLQSGKLAGLVYSKRDSTFEAWAIARNLNLRRQQNSDTTFQKNRLSVRSQAVRYVLANLKYQFDGVRIDIIRSGHVIRALFDHIKEDPPDIVIDTIRTIKSRLITDSTIPRAQKSQVLSDHNLKSIASLYRKIAENEASQEIERLVNEEVHEFLTLVCSDPSLGILIRSPGWYPHGLDVDSAAEKVLGQGYHSIDSGLDSVYEAHSSGKVAFTRNVVLSSLAQALRPHSNLLEQELLLVMFRSAPELVCEYFEKKAFLTFDPKLTSTWLGHMSTLFRIIQLPVPQFFGHKYGYASAPPPHTIVVNNILPRPLSQTVLTNGLNHSSTLINFMTIRLLLVAFQKYEEVLSAFQQASKQENELWKQWITALKNEFTRRCPSFKSVVALFRKLNKGSVLEKEAISRLLMRCYSLVPEQAVCEKLDLSFNIISSLTDLDKDDYSAVERQLIISDLGHLIHVAQFSPSMKWWSKPDSLKYSPFIELVRLLATTTIAERGSIRSLIAAISDRHFFFQRETSTPPLDALLKSCENEKQLVAADEVFSFLESCIGRVVRRPIVYQSKLEGRQRKLERDQTPHPKPLSAIVEAMCEQWPFVANGLGANAATEVARWILRFFDCLKAIGEDAAVFDSIIPEMAASAGDRELRNAFYDQVDRNSPNTDLLAERVLAPNNVAVAETSQLKEIPDLLCSLEAEEPGSALSEDEDHPELLRWMRKDIEEVIDGGDAGKLLLCLCSKHQSIRMQALAYVRKLKTRLESSDHDARDQICLLLAELLETAENVIHEKPLPYIAGVFARNVIPVLTHPAHCLYVQVNRFLNKGPAWNVEMIPSYWAGKTLLEPPEEDNAYQKSAEWFLDLLHDGLRTQEDMNICRARSIFERVLSHYSSPTCRDSLKARIRRLLHRALAVGGGETLITRASLYEWCQAQLSLSGESEREHFEVMLSRLEATRKSDRVAIWSGKGIACC